MNRHKFDRDMEAARADYEKRRQLQIKQRGKPFRTAEEGPKIIEREDYNMVDSRVVEHVGVICVDWPDDSKLAPGIKHLMILRSVPSGEGEWRNQETGVIDLEEAVTLSWWFDTIDVEQAVKMYYALTKEWERDE